jgi:hypothetical protein
MLEAGPALKVTIHLNRDTGGPHGFLAEDVLDFLRQHGIEGATAIQAYSGYGAHRQLHTSGAGDVEGLHLPIIIHFVEQQSKVDAILDDLLAMVTDGLVEAHPTHVLRNVASSEKVIS